MIIDDNLNIFVKPDNNVCGLLPRGRVEGVILVEQLKLMLILVVSKMIEGDNSVLLSLLQNF